ncbi:MAG TPA: fumarylacetoacetate hydrolase family protein [Streptosporangiaceae bacterium]|nr:fumarylacetoacetate hydrolase family protein [Streptosporangiaceae bacterium]
MHLCTFKPKGGDPTDARPGRVEEDHVVRLEAPTLQAVLAVSGRVPDGPALPLSAVELLAPVPQPPAVRDFFAFEQHVATTRGNRGAAVPDEWYEIPVFYFTNPAAICGPDEDIPYPSGTTMLDYELEVAAVIKEGGEIGGFTIMNDWSARDLQRKETRVGLGPAKGKDFATSIGPVLVTTEEFDGSHGEMIARVNGEERSRGNLADLYHSWEAMIARASENTTLRPGDVIGSGTVGTGCILEHDDGRWLRPGDVVELEVEGLGVLRNRIVERAGHAV